MSLERHRGKFCQLYGRRTSWADNIKNERYRNFKTKSTRVQEPNTGQFASIRYRHVKTVCLFYSPCRTPLPFSLNQPTTLKRERQRLATRSQARTQELAHEGAACSRIGPQVTRWPPRRLGALRLPAGPPRRPGALG